MQYKPPTLKKKSSSNQQESPTKPPPPHSKPPGYHLVARKTNFSGTYTLDQDKNSPDKPSSYHPQIQAGVKTRSRGTGPIIKATIPKSLSSFSHGRIQAHTSATSPRKLPGSTSEPGLRERSGMAGGRGEREIEGESSFAPSNESGIHRRRSQLKTPQPVVSCYTNNHLGNGFGDRRGEIGRVGLVRQIRGISDNDGSHFSSSSSLGDGEPPRLAPVKPKGKSRRYDDL